MPKKFTGENTKASNARARKASAKELEDAKKKKEAEDALWKDDDKHVLRKQQRKEEQERKKTEKLEKKAENKALLEEDMKAIKFDSKRPQAKITQAQIQAENEMKRLNSKTAVKVETNLSKPLEENINRVVIEGEEAHSVAEAIAILSVKEPQMDRHPERRMKAAFAAFEEANMPRLKAENPTLRLSQLKQLLKKEWMKSESNPANQIHIGAV